MEFFAILKKILTEMVFTKKFEISDLPVEGQAEYHRILERIKSASTGITISPIDVIIKKNTGCRL